MEQANEKKAYARKVCKAIDEARRLVSMYEGMHGESEKTNDAFELLSDALNAMVEERDGIAY